MNVLMIGSGYVGLVSGACFSEFGANVTCLDTNKLLINELQKGKIPIYEPGLDELVERNLKAGRLSFTDNLPQSVKTANIIFITVGTPTRRGDGHADLKYVYDVANELAQHINDYTLIVNKSTVPIGTAREVKRIIQENNPDADFDIASNPEFLREGSAIGDFMRPDRVILGVENKRAGECLKELYRPLNLIETPILITDLESAELIKYASNAFLASKISFINEMSFLCEKTGADVHAVAKGMGLDRRIGSKFLHVGPGYGGSCFPKDTLALIKTFEDLGIENKIVKAAVEVNEDQKVRMVEKIANTLDNSITNKRIAVLGLTFKPETDDMRDAPSLSILPPLINKGASIIAHDPAGIKQARKLLPKNIEFSNSIEEVFKNADAVLLLTEWNEYRGLDLQKIKKSMKGDIFIDLRNVYEPEQMKRDGYKYYCIGRNTNLLSK